MARILKTDKYFEMRIVILTPIPFWHPGTAELMGRLKIEGYDVIALDIWNLLSCDVSGKITTLKALNSRGLLERLLNKVLRRSITFAFIRDFDIIDIHWCDPNYSKYVSLFRKRKVKIISTIFGSDFYRIDKPKMDNLRMLFAESDKVLIGENMKQDFFSVFPQIREKTIFNQYGSERLEIINRLMLEDIESFRFKWGISSEDIVTTIGYNAKKEQQHFIFFNALKDIPYNILQKIVLIIPLTYGRDEHPEYYLELLSEINSIGIKKAIIIDKRLTDIEIAESKIISDITINLQTTDALSSSIKEAFAAGNVVIAGKWLPYGIYEELGLFFYRTGVTELNDLLLSVISEVNSEKAKCKLNPEIIYKFASWTSVMPDFINTYRQLSNEWN